VFAGLILEAMPVGAGGGTIYPIISSILAGWRETLIMADLGRLPCAILPRISYSKDGSTASLTPRYGLGLAPTPARPVIFEPLNWEAPGDDKTGNQSSGAGHKYRKGWAA
jgi:hypothetical protein